MDAELKHLAHGYHLPKDLAARYPSLQTITFLECSAKVPPEVLADAILNLPNLRSLQNVNRLYFIAFIRSRTSAEDLIKVGVLQRQAH